MRACTEEARRGREREWGGSGRRLYVVFHNIHMQPSAMHQFCCDSAALGRTMRVAQQAFIWAC
eukprot:352743-Chlamydomonas_euryale.AAC.18